MEVSNTELPNGNAPVTVVPPAAFDHRGRGGRAGTDGQRLAVAGRAGEVGVTRVDGLEAVGARRQRPLGVELGGTPPTRAPPPAGVPVVDAADGGEEGVGHRAGRGEARPAGEGVTVEVSNTELPNGNGPVTGAFAGRIVDHRGRGRGAGIDGQRLAACWSNR